MTRKVATKWCPKGCGKSVMYLERDYDSKVSMFHCTRCESKFSKGQLE